MKRKPILKKHLYLLLSFVFVITLNACEKNNTSPIEPKEALPTPTEMVTASPDQPSDSDSSQTSEDVSSETEAEPSATETEPSATEDVPTANDDALAAYNNFLAGSIEAQDLKHEISDGIVTMKDISLEPDLKTYYAFYDMNGDGVQELHLRPIVGGSYAIFTYLDGQIVLWHDGPDYESPLNNGAILYERDGAAPTHINYYYLVLDSEGNEISRVSFSKYHSVDESTLTESDEYDEFMIEDEEVSEDEWNSQTNEYLSNPSDLIIWNEL